MKIFILLLLPCLACNNTQVKTLTLPNTTDSVKRNFDFIWDAKQVSSKQVPDLLNNVFDSLSFEVTDLYAQSDSIPDDDFLSLDDSLKSRGFKVINWGRGNWEKGPRLMSLNLESDSFNCRLDKLYYEDSTNRHILRVTERVAFLAK